MGSTCQDGPDFQKELDAAKALTNTQTYLLSGNGFFSSQASIESFNLASLLAFAILQQALNRLKNEGRFNCKGKRPLLGTLMEKAKDKLIWREYELLSAGIGVRNDFAHEAKLAPKDDCLKYIQAVENELKGWGILEDK